MKDSEQHTNEWYFYTIYSQFFGLNSALVLKFCYIFMCFPSIFRFRVRLHVIHNSVAFWCKKELKWWKYNNVQSWGAKVYFGSSRDILWGKVKRTVGQTKLAIDPEHALRHRGGTVQKHVIPRSVLVRFWVSKSFCN